MKTYELIFTAVITVNARDEEDAVERSLPLARMLISQNDATLHIGVDDLNNATIEEVAQ